MLLFLTVFSCNYLSLEMKHHLDRYVNGLTLLTNTYSPSTQPSILQVIQLFSYC